MAVGLGGPRIGVPEPDQSTKPVSLVYQRATKRHRHAITDRFGVPNHQGPLSNRGLRYWQV